MIHYTMLPVLGPHLCNVRFSNLISRVKPTVDTCMSLVPLCKVQVRFRKPRHLGRAPSKGKDYFKKYYPTPKDLEENRHLYHEYNLLLKSIVAAFQEEIALKSAIQNTVKQYTWNEEEHHQKCMIYNDAENKRLHAIRMQRIENERNKIVEEDKEELKAQQEQKEKLRQELIDTIKESENWLTLENMEEKITEAVNNPVNYNFSINKFGFIESRTALVLPPDDENDIELQEKSG